MRLRVHRVMRTRRATRDDLLGGARRTRSTREESARRVERPSDVLNVSSYRSRTSPSAPGIAAGTIRMWEQRYGFPAPERTRVGLPPLPRRRRRGAAPRRRPTAIAACRSPPRSSAPARRARRSDHPSIYAAVAAIDRGARARRCCASARSSRSAARSSTRRSPTPRRRCSSRPSSARRSTARSSRATGGWPRTPTTPSSSPTSPRCAAPPGGPTEIPIDRDDALGNEWAVVVDAPGLRRVPAGLGAARRDRAGRARRPRRGASRRSGPSTRAATRRAAQVGGAARRSQPTRTTAQRLERAAGRRGRWRCEQPAPALTALTNRVVAYLEPARARSRAARRSTSLPAGRPRPRRA